jgi:hypothetical protein
VTRLADFIADVGGRSCFLSEAAWLVPWADSFSAGQVDQAILNKSTPANNTNDNRRIMHPSGMRVRLAYITAAESKSIGHLAHIGGWRAISATLPMGNRRRWPHNVQPRSSRRSPHRRDYAIVACA